MKTTPLASINLAAIKKNYDLLKTKCGGQKLIAVIKGDAYGHNAVRVAQTLPHADQFAVARIEEAIQLRTGGITQPIMLLEGCFFQDDLQLAASLNLDIVIHCESQMQQFENITLNKRIRVWLKLDTGMHRLGVQASELSAYLTRIERTGNVREEVGFISHFSCADDLSSAKTAQQIELFQKTLQLHKGPKSIANSAGILFWPDSQFDIARAGIALYGISPNQDVSAKELGLTAAMSLTTALISTRHHKQGQTVGYGDIWVSDRDTILGVIALGYGDGYPRLAPAGTPVYINGRCAPIVGRVSMDMIVIDLGPDSVDKCGDMVELWGNNLPIERVAKYIETIPYELTIKLTTRVGRRYHEVATTY